MHPEPPNRRWIPRLCGGAALPLAAFLIVCSFAATPGLSQVSVRDLVLEVADLREQVASLRAQLNDVSREVFRGGDVAQRPAATEDGQLSERLRRLESEIDRMGERERRVTGRFDEVENLIGRIESRIERLVADVDFRLSALERDGGRQPSDLAGDAASPPSEAVASETAGSVARTPGTGYEPSGAPRALGTIAVPAEGGAQQDAPPAGETPDQQYDRAFTLLQTGRYEEADAVLARFVEENPAHPRAENAAYWRGESLYARQMYGEAARAYALNLQAYPDGPKAPDNMVKLGMALIRLGRPEAACQTFDQLDRTFPEMPTNIRQAATQGRSQAGCA